MNSNREFRSYGVFRIIVPLIVLAVIVSVFAIAYIIGAFPDNIYFPFYFFPLWIFFPLLFFALFSLAFRGCGWGTWWGSEGYYYNDPAMAVLRERLARGEIGKEQYDQMIKDLEAF